MALTKVSYSMINGAVVNALDFGADATGTNDSTAALQAALDHCGTTLQTLFLPAGTYKVDNTLTWPSSGGSCAAFQLIGESASVISGSVSDATIINFNNADDNLFDLSGGNFIGAIKNISIYGVPVKNTNVALYSTNLKSAVLENISISNFNYGIHINAGDAYYSIIKNLHIKDCTRGIFAYQCGFNGTTIDASRFDSNGYGIYTTYSGFPLTVRGCWFESNTTAGISASNPTLITIDACYFEENGSYDFYIAAEAFYKAVVNITNSTFESRASAGYSALINGAYYVNLVGNRFLAYDASENVRIINTYGGGMPYGIASGNEFTAALTTPMTATGTVNMLILDDKMASTITKADITAQKFKRSIAGGTCGIDIVEGDGNYVRLASGGGTGDFTVRPNGSIKMTVSVNGNISGTQGTTGMTNGFFYIPSATGAPSGVPTAVTGTVPMYYDSTNNHFYIYNGAWKKVALT